MARLRPFYAALCCICAIHVAAQEDIEDLDLLKAPASPASNMLGIATEEVQRPTDVTAFMASLRQATDDFSALPVNYAADFAPYWLCRKGDQGTATERVLRKDKLGAGEGSTAWERFAQSVVVSTAVAGLGTADGEDPRDTKAGFGLKMSLITPEANTGTVDALNDIRAGLRKMGEVDALQVQQRLDADAEYLAYQQLMTAAAAGSPEKAVYVAKMVERRAAMEEEIEREWDAAEVARLSKLGEDFEIEREGAFLDLSTGLAIEFVDRDFGNGQFRQGGLWLTGGYTLPGFTATGMGRLLFEAPVTVALSDSTSRSDNVKDLDLGANIAFDKNGRPFTFSLEWLLRMKWTGEETTDTWRLVANASYSFQENKAITFSFGRNFDGTTTQGGNLVAALNLLLGFGGSKK